MSSYTDFIGYCSARYNISFKDSNGRDHFFRNVQFKSIGQCIHILENGVNRCVTPDFEYRVCQVDSMGNQIGNWETYRKNNFCDD